MQNGSDGCFFLLGMVEGENPSGMDTAALGLQIFIRIANFSDSESKFDFPGPSANCCGVKVRKRTFIIASLIVGWLLFASLVAFTIF